MNLLPLSVNFWPEVFTKLVLWRGSTAIAIDSPSVAARVAAVSVYFIITKRNESECRS